MDKLFQNSPVFFQNLMISAFNFFQYRKRYSGNYKKYRDELKSYKSLHQEDILGLQKKYLEEFLTYVHTHSDYYKSVVNSEDALVLGKYPILTKEVLRNQLDAIKTIDATTGIKSKTGGTTGKSLEIYFTHDDMQRRFAFLDNFRAEHGYELGKKTAWFSGKTLLNTKDIIANRFWKTDHLYHVRYYSTFHIKEDYLIHYINDLKRFKPEFIVGFPSSILEIARYGLRMNIDFPEGIQAIFPTAETVTQEMKDTLAQFFKTEVYDQYASSEGAPFIFECKNRKLHLELLSGTFEVLGDDNRPANEGRLVITSFSTHGTPLIRYDIGDVVVLSDDTCNCGNNNPLVRQINGRIDDYIYSPENGKINLGNVSNTLKDTKGIVKFQAVQNDLNKIDIYLKIDQSIFNEEIQKKFLKNWRERVGDKMEVNLIKVDDIPNEKSGKFRIVKNNIKHLVQ